MNKMVRCSISGLLFFYICVKIHCITRIHRNNMKTKILFLLGIFAISSAMGAVRSDSIKSKPEHEKSDWAKFYRYKGVNDTVTMSPNVVFMGNSITDFWAKRRQDFFKKYNIAGRGISGQTSSQMLVRFRRDVLDLKPKAVVILSGTNDIAQNNGYIALENVLGNIVSMCELAKCNGVQPVIASVLPCAIFSWSPELMPADDIKALNEMLQEYAAKENIPYVDYYTALTDERGGLPEKWSDDGCHPNNAAYEIMETIVLKTITPYISR